MLAFARETRLSETTFVQTPTAPGADYRNRIWTVAGELPFAGHPSLGTAVAVASAAGQTDPVSYVQQTGAGLQPIDVALSGSVATASMLQEPAAFLTELEPAPSLATLGLSPTAGHPDLAPQVVSTGLPHLMLPLRSLEDLAIIVPDYQAIHALLEPHGAVGIYAAVLTTPTATTAADARSTDIAAARARSADTTAVPARRTDITAARARPTATTTVRARFFAHDPRIGEDPATGSAAGPLCAYLHQRLGVHAVTISQGVEMGRPSVLRTELAADRVRVSGDAVIVISGTVRL